MAADDKTLSFRTDAERANAIENWRERHGKSTRQDAIESLVEIGLRESTNPIMYRLKDQVIDWAGHLGLAAIVVLVAGFTTTVFTPMHSLQVALVLVAMALALIGIVELARVGTGQSELADVLRGDKV